MVLLWVEVFLSFGEVMFSHLLFLGGGAFLPHTIHGGALDGVAVNLLLCDTKINENM